MENQQLFEQINAEIKRSVEKHGEYRNIPCLYQELLDCSAQRMAEEYEIPTAIRAKFMTDKATERGELTHAHIVVEELCEAVECMDDKKAMREELIQLACVVVKWINAIDYQTETL